MTVTLTDTDTAESAVQTWGNVITVMTRGISHTYDPLYRLTVSPTAR